MLSTAERKKMAGASKSADSTKKPALDTFLAEVGCSKDMLARPCNVDRYARLSKQGKRKLSLPRQRWLFVFMCDACTQTVMVVA